MKKLPTISIGIPAFNESANIGQLLRLLLAQKGNNFLLQKIFVLSDGSTDTTEQVVAAVGNNKIYFRDDKKRLGKSARLSEIFRLNRSDVLILMDADVVFKDEYLLSKLINRVDFERIGIAAINAQPLPPKTFLPRSLDAGVYIVKRIAMNWNNGDNYLSFKGCFLALSHNVVEKVQIPAHLTNNDAFLYFAAKKLGFNAAYVPQCNVYFKSPEKLSDHINQNSRFEASQNELKKYFSASELSYSPPRLIVLKSMGEAFVKNPLFFVSYVGIHVISKMKKQQVLQPAWKIADSTKQKIALR